MTETSPEDKLLAYVTAFRKRHHFRLPTYREMAKEFTTSTSVIGFWLGKLNERGSIAFEELESAGERLKYRTRYFYVVENDGICPSCGKPLEEAIVEDV